MMPSSSPKPHRAKVRQQKEALESERQWRKMRWVLTGFLVSASGIALLLLGIVRLPLTASGRLELRQYEMIRSALARDQLVEAKTAALALASNRDAKQSFVKAALAISQSDSLDAARNEFVSLSEATVKLVAHRTGYFVMHCFIQGCPEPCENCPMAHFGSWVQTNGIVENPFMGLRHSKCGVVDKSL